MFLYLTIILFLGVRFDKNERFVIEWPKGDPTSIFDAASFAPGDTGGFFTEIGSEAGLLGIVIGFILDIIATIVIVFVISILLWIGLNGILAVSLAVCVPLFFFYRRALRSVVTKGRRCQGNIKASLLHALKSTLGYTIWFYGIFMIAHHIEQMRPR